MHLCSLVCVYSTHLSFVLQISSFEKDIVSASLVCMDGNISVEAIEYICQLCQNHHIPGKCLGPLVLSIVNLSR